jgi:iron complex outermembrane receptor protein
MYCLKPEGSFRTPATSRSRSRSPLALGVAMAISSMILPTQSYAQSNEIDEVVVTARFREENVQTIPIAITAISGDELQARSLDTVEDIGLVIPNAFFRENVGNYGPTGTIGLRGITQNDYSYAFEPAVAVYIDDVYHGTLTGSDMDLMDMERVEVLRGPQGTLFGKNSIGGAVRLISKKPEGDNSGSVDLTYGRFDRVDVRAIGAFSLIDDKLFMRLAGISRQRDGYGKYLDFTCHMIARGTPELAGIGDGIAGYENVGGSMQPILVTPGSAADNAFSLPASVDARGTGDCALGEYGGQQTDAGRVMLRYLATDKLELNFAADFTQTNNDPLPQTLLTGHRGGYDAGYSDAIIRTTYGIPYAADDRFVSPDSYTNYATFRNPLNGTGYNPQARTDSEGYSLTADYRISDTMKLRAIFAEREYQTLWASDTDFTPFPIQHTDNVQDHEQTQAELQLSGTALDNQALEWTVGAFYFDSESRAYNTTEFGAFDWSGLLPNFVANDFYTTTNKSVFVHLDYQLTQRLSVSGGLRYTEEEKTNIFDHQPGTLPVIGPVPFNGNRNDWKISLDYQLNDFTFLYGQVATGFRSAGFTPRIFTLGQLQPIPPEEVRTYEIGAKIELWDRRITANSAIFMSDYDPRLIQVGGVSQCDDPLEPNPTPYFLQGGFCPTGTALSGSTGLPWFYYSNAPGSIEGFESEIQFLPSDNLALNLTLGYNSYDNDESDPTQATYRHSSALLQPEWNLSGGIQYTWNLDGDAAIVPRLDWFYQSKRTNGAVNQPNNCPEECIPEYHLFNGRISYENYANNLSISLAVTNLLDKFYWQQLAAEFTATGAIPSARTGVPSRPREWAITVRKSF